MTVPSMPSATSTSRAFWPSIPVRLAESTGTTPTMRGYLARKFLISFSFFLATSRLSLSRMIARPYTSRGPSRAPSRWDTSFRRQKGRTCKVVMLSDRYFQRAPTPRSSMRRQPYPCCSSVLCRFFSLRSATCDCRSLLRCSASAFFDLLEGHETLGLRSSSLLWVERLRFFLATTGHPLQSVDNMERGCWSRVPEW